MKRFISWIHKKLPIIKTIFLLSVIMIVVGQISLISKTISPTQLTAVLLAIPWWKFACLVVVGLLAVLPMVGYDMILNKLLGRKPGKVELVETSWLISTINNVAGFGGRVSVGLRSTIYGKGSEDKEVSAALSRVILFFMSGLSIYSFISYLLVTFTSRASSLGDYSLLLLGAGLYFPAVFLFAMVRKKGLLGGLSGMDRGLLVLVSFLEWSGVWLSFWLTGVLMGVQFDPLQILPLFIAAAIIGILSMIPGQWGIFDVMMVLSLSAIGIPRQMVIIWLLLFRICYYLIPFLIGTILFFEHTGVGVNRRFAGVPRELLQEAAHKILTFAMYFSGIMMVLLATIPHAFVEFRWLDHLNPWRYHLISQFPSLLLGFLLLMMGRGMAARVKKAYVPTLLLLFVAIIYSLFRDFSLVPVIFLCLLLFFTFISKGELYRKQFVYSWEALTKDGMIFLSLMVLYIVVGVYNLPSFGHHAQFITFFLFPSEKAWLSGLAAIVVVAAFILTFVKYLEGEKQTIGTAVDEVEVARILKTYGGNVYSQLVYLGDKQVYFYHDGVENTVFFQMSTYNDKCVVMGNPSGKAADFPQAIRQLVEEADDWCYLPVFYEVSEDIIMQLHELGYDFIKMGEAAEVDLTQFTMSGKKKKTLRALMNQLHRQNNTFEVVAPPFSEGFIEELRAVSDEWLDGRKEKGFSLGYFSESYFSRAPVAVARNEAGEVIAFATLTPTYTEGLAAIDMMRHSPTKAPAGIMDFVFIHLFEYLQEQGVKTFDMGMAPLSNVGRSKKSFIQERAAYLVYQFGNRFYSFQGLRDYKKKYTKIWSPQYTAYSRESWVGYVMAVLLVIDNAPVEKEAEVRGLRKFLRNLI